MGILASRESKSCKEDNNFSAKVKPGAPEILTLDFRQNTLKLKQGFKKNQSTTAKIMTTLEKLEKLIYEGFKETDQRFQDGEQRSQEADRRSQEADQRSQEADQRSQEAEQRSREADRRLQETERVIKEYTREQKEIVDRIGKQIGGLTKSLGLFAESMVYPSVVRLFAERGIALTGAYTRSLERRNGSTMEVDVLGVGPETVVAIEAKLRLEQAYVKEFLKRLPNFFDFFPRFRGLKLYGAVAGMSIDKDADRYAYKNGLFVLAPSGDNMRIINDDKFIPRPFGEMSKPTPRRKK